MNVSYSRRWLLAVFLVGTVAVPCLSAPPGAKAGYGRVSGIVLDTQGNPLMGATVLIIGPVLVAPPVVERIITDTQGKFTVERLVPGRYSLRVTSATRLPALRDSVRVEAGQTSEQKFVLSDIFAPLRIQVPTRRVSTWGDDWKWVLRTSSTTRPVLRYHEAARATPAPKPSKPLLPPCQRLIGMLPGSTLGKPLGGDPGLGSVLAYVRSLSEGADFLVASSMTANGIQASSIATAFRKNMLKGDPQELALVVHQLDLSEGLPLASGDTRGSMTRGQGLVFTYDHTRRLSDALSLTSGLEVDYLNALRDAVTARPRLKLEYRVNASSTVAVRYGVARADDSGSLLERIGQLRTFPRVTLRGYRPQIETMNHAEAIFSRSLGKNSRVETAAYRDYFQNTAVWGFGGPEVLGRLAGNVLPNPAANGLTLNAGNYQSSGVWAAYTRTLGRHVKTAFVYSFGEALAVNTANFSSDETWRNLRAVVHPSRSQSVAGKISTRIPISKTQITTSYEWLERGRVTGLDPYGQASLQLQPFLGIQIRQPLPTLALLPARIEAVADFRNLLAQGYIPLYVSGDDRLFLTPAYRSFRGGFSLQF